MIWLIMAGGRGLRTQLLGEFKPFIEIKGHKIATWLLFSVKPNIKAGDRFIFTTTDYFSKKFDFKNELQTIFDSLKLKNKFEIFTSEDFLPGNSFSIYLAKSRLTTEEPVVIFCCDQFTDFRLPPKILPKTGYLTIGLDFSKDRDKGYIEVQDGLITKFAEKEPISNFVSSGIFILSSGKALILALKNQFKDQAISANGEYCIGPVFNYLIKDGFKIYPLLPKAHYSLGSIPAIEYFSSSPITEGLSKLLTKGDWNAARV